MNQEVKDALRFHRKVLIVEHILMFSKVKQQCREFEVPTSTYYEWKKKYDKYGREGLIRKKPIPLSHPKQLKQNVIDNIIELRKTYQLGPQRIAWYLERYHGVTTSSSTVYRTLVRNGLRRLPKSTPRRAIHTKRYSKTVPGAISLACGRLRDPPCLYKTPIPSAEW